MTDPITDVKTEVDSLASTAEHDVASAKADVVKAKGFLSSHRTAIEIGAALLICALLVAHFL